MKRPRSKGTPSKEAQDLAEGFLSELEADRIANPGCALASMLQGIRDGAEETSAERIRTLEGHRSQWRRIAFALFDAIERLDAYADPTEVVRAQVDQAMAMIRENGSGPPMVDCFCDNGTDRSLGYARVCEVCNGRGVRQCPETPLVNRDRDALAALVDFVRSDQCDGGCICCRAYLDVANAQASNVGLPDGFTCWKCDGDGKVGETACRRCGGSGRLGADQRGGEARK